MFVRAPYNVRAPCNVLNALQYQGRPRVSRGLGTHSWIARPLCARLEKNRDEKLWHKRDALRRVTS